MRLGDVLRRVDEVDVADIVDALPSGGTLEQRVDGGVDAMVAGYSSAPAVSAFEIVAALQSGERVVLLDGFDEPGSAMQVRERILARWV